MMFKSRLLFCLIAYLLIFSCESSDDIAICHKYDVVLIIGQSNTHSGLGLDLSIDFANPRIKQLGRFGDRDLKIVDAIEPLDHQTRIPNKIGFGLTFSKLYLDSIKAFNTEVLVIPCGFGGTGFIDNRWNKGDDLYTDAIERVKYVLNLHPNSELKVILWHQGESDISNLNYQSNLDSMIINIRKDLDIPTIPFILGGMVPYWVEENEKRINQQSIIRATTQRIQLTGYVDPTSPFKILKADNENDKIHFDAIGQRELGRRYFGEYQKLIKTK